MMPMDLGLGRSRRTAVRPADRPGRPPGQVSMPRPGRAWSTANWRVRCLLHILGSA